MTNIAHRKALRLTSAIALLVGLLMFVSYRFEPLKCKPTAKCHGQVARKLTAGMSQGDGHAPLRLASAQAAGVRDFTSEVFALGRRSKTSWRYSAGLIPCRRQL